MLVAQLGIDAPLWAAAAFFAGAWLVAQVAGHAGLPLLHVTYAEDGGELGRGGPWLSVAAPAVVLAVLSVAWAAQPPLVRLPAGTHAGPLILDRSQRLVGDDGAVVLGGIVIAADDVTVENVTVVGGENGFTVDDVDDIVLDRVRVVRAELDGINVRRSEIIIRDCEISGLRSDYAQGIDISFSMHRQPSTVDGCRVEGGWEGIVSHSATVRVRDNRCGRRPRAASP